MKSGVSSLNPYAASYVPLSKRETYDRVEPTTQDSNVWQSHPVHLTQNQHHTKVSLGPAVHGAEKLPNLVHQGSFGSSSSKQTVDDELDIDLEYLQMSFPGLSYQSLSDVYLANKGDLEATVDMLTQLEFGTVETSENLPDTLDIGDVSESGSSSECASLKLKKVVGEASSSGASDSAVVS